MPRGDILYLVIPCYNEEEVLPETSRRLREKMTALMEAGRISPRSRVLFVDDGSKDRTWELIGRLHREDSLFSGAKLSRNRGHQNALLGGLTAAVDRGAQVTISMDADLQDDIDAIDAFLDQYEEGCQVVYGVRSDRTTDSAFKRDTAQAFYKLMAWMGAEVVYNHADYRLMSRRAVEELLRFKEVNLFLRGMVPLVGFRSGQVTYKRGERFAGQSKYPLKKMLAFAVNGITSFSVKPIRLVLAAGILLGVLAVLGLVIAALLAVTGLASVSGLWWLGLSLWLLGAIQLAALGVVGEYVGKIYLEAKARPSFILETVLDGEEEPGR
ncbi:MAG TPA: glycosyltransferase family 2 protein [Firmicutes bacterium]|nr:glycosyltransferase family 2 protein [Bacillota bacterium]